MAVFLCHETEVYMVRTITEKFIDGKLVERITVEDAHQDTLTIPYQYPYPWWGIYHPYPWYTVSTTGNANTGSSATIATNENITYTN